jgi:hypothetical protein
MQYTGLPALIADHKRALGKGPVCLMLVEDDTLLAETISHHRALGFGALILFCPPDLAVPDQAITRVDHDLGRDGGLPAIVNALMPRLVGRWVYVTHNAEFLFYPFSESRSLPELLTFLGEERRDAAMTHVIDLYAADLGQHPDGVDMATACFDGSGYFAVGKTDTLGNRLDRQIDIFGGLRWRFEEFIPVPRRRLDRIGLFRATKGLVMDAEGQFNIAEYNTYACPWHHSPTAAVCSFRAAKALRRNPGSREAIHSFHWHKSQPFSWQAQQLLDLGMMEPGQWF